MGPPKIGGQPPKTNSTTGTPIAARPPPAPVAAPAAAPARPRSTRFEAARPAQLAAMRPPPPPAFQQLGKNPAGTTGSQVFPSKSGPIPASAWNNPTEIVGNLRQDTGRPGDVSGDDRCGPTNLLAGALLQGKDAAAGLLAAAAKSKNLTPDQQKKLADIGKAVKTGIATYDQLNEATALMYKAANTRYSLDEAKSDPAFDVSNLGAKLGRFRELAAKDPARLSKTDQKELSDLLTLATGKKSEVTVADDPRGNGKKVAFVKIDGARPGDHSGLDDGEIAAYAKSIGLNTKSKAIDAAGAADGAEVTGNIIDKLKKGESTVLRIGLTSQDGDPNHFVTVGRLPDGRPYIYNPSPAGGESTLTIGSNRPPQPDDFVNAQDQLDQRVRTDRDGATPRTLKVKD